MSQTRDPHDILIRPLLTEKITSLRDAKNCVAFVVHPKASRLDVRNAVEKALKVRVASVNVMNVRGKLKRQGRFVGRRAGWRKAIVTLREGEKLELYESA